MQTINTTFHGQAVSIFTTDAGDNVQRVTLRVTEGTRRMFQPYDLGFGVWSNGSFEFCTAVCKPAELEALSAELRAHGWN